MDKLSISEEQERQKHLLDLFVHPGWKLLMEEMRQEHEVLVETAYTVADEKALYKRKGEIQKLTELLAFEALTKMADETSWNIESDG